MPEARHRILVVGAGGMLGSAAFRFFADDPACTTYGTLRSSSKRRWFHADAQDRLLANVDAVRDDSLIDAFAVARPDLVINCVGIVKQLVADSDHPTSITINALLPHRLARLCALAGARLVHISTDCVFSGRRGNYREADFADADDLYGRSKYLGEVDYPHALTLRTSIIGHELDSRHGLIDWFLGEERAVAGYAQAYFSGLPTIELCRIIRDHVLGHDLHGLYHVSAARISKHDLLCLVRDIYGHEVAIHADDRLAIDRTLDSARFRAATGFHPRPWPEMIADLHRYYSAHDFARRPQPGEPN